MTTSPVQWQASQVSPRSVSGSPNQERRNFLTESPPYFQPCPASGAARAQLVLTQTMALLTGLPLSCPYAADANILINTCRLQAQRYLFTYQEPIPVEQLVRWHATAWSKEARNNGVSPCTSENLAALHTPQTKGPWLMPHT